MRSCSKFPWAFGATTAIVAICYFFFDRPFSYYAFSELRVYRPYFHFVTPLPKFIGFAVVGCALLAAIHAFRKRVLTRDQGVVVLAAFSLGLSNILENWAKYAFGRTWPETWIQDNPSLIRDGVHNFNPFHGGLGYAAFPSGHMTATGAIISVFWFLLPRFRLVYMAVIALVFVSQAGANYHFLSDLVAGGLLGFTAGVMTIAIWDAMPSSRQPSNDL